MSAVYAKVDNLVLGTVNAPWKRSIDADTLAALIATTKVDGWQVHLATFFAEVRSSLILAFAQTHGISVPALLASYTMIKAQTGETNADLETDLAQLGKAA